MKRLRFPLAAACRPALFVALLAACAVSPEPRFYTLAAPTLEASAPIADLQQVAIVVDPAALSELVDRPQWVARRSASEVGILEQQRWAVPLRVEIARVVGENLSALLATRQVLYDHRGPAPAGAYRLGLEVLAFEMLPTGEVGVEIAWRIRPGAGQAVAGRAEVREGVAGSDFDAAAAAYSRALSAVSREIAEAVRGLEAAAR